MRNYDRNGSSGNDFIQGEWVRLHVKEPYEYTKRGRNIILQHIYDTHAEIHGDRVEFTAYGITEDIHELLMEKRARGEVLLERPSKEARH